MTLVTVDAHPVAALTALFDDGLPAPGPGDPLPPYWHLAACSVPPPTGDLGPDGHPRSALVTAPPGLPRRMFAGGRLTAFAAVRVGERLDRTQRVTASSDKQGRSGPLRFTTAQAAFRRPDAGIVLVEEQDIVYRAAPGPAHAPQARAAAGTACDADPGRLLTRGGEPLRAVFRADSVALQRFSAATSNPHRIHYDHPYVTSVEGYPGLVVHGPLLLLAMLELIRLDLPALLVTGVSFRAQAPVFAGDAVGLAGEVRPGGVVRLTARRADGPAGPDFMTVECVTEPG